MEVVMLRLFTFTDSSSVPGYKPVMCVSILAYHEEDAITAAAQRIEVPTDDFRRTFKGTVREVVAPGVVCVVGYHQFGLDVQFS